MKRTLEEAEKIIALYEQSGAAKLFYALNRKMGEMADALNKARLDEMDLSDAKDKRFDRLKVIWNEASSISTAVDTLAKTSGITNDETQDTQHPKYKITTPESISDVLGNPAGQIN